MYFVQYFRRTAQHSLVEGVGDRAVLVLDGRWSLDTMTDVAWEHDESNGGDWDGFQIRRGETFSRCHNMTSIVNMDGRTH